MITIKMPVALFTEHCHRYGFSIDEAMPCVVENLEDYLIIDQASGFFPVVPKPSVLGDFPQIASGPGTELHAILERFGMTASGDCKCTSRAAYMDRMESEQPGWCEANIEEIVGWLRESATERGLPFLDWPARLLIRRAIANARRKDAARAEGSPHHDRREAVAPPGDAPQG